MADTDKSALDKMVALRDDLHARLLNNQDYRALVALDRVIKDLAAPEKMEWGAPIGGIRRVHHIRPRLTGDRPISQGDAAEQALVKAGQPLPITDLLTLTRDQGAVVDGTTPSVNLSSSLSRDKRFVSMRINGVYSWWLADRPLPASALLEDADANNELGSG